MKYRTRIYYTAEQKAEMWDRWKKGESLHAIAQLFDRYHTSIHGILAATGGIQPRERRRSGSEVQRIISGYFNQMAGHDPSRSLGVSI